MNQNKTLLLPGSSVSEDSNLRDIIYQSIYDLKSNPPQKDVIQLFQNIISYLDNNIEPKLMDDFILLSTTCFSKITNQDEFINELLGMAQDNSNKLIVFTAAITKVNRRTTYPNIYSFVSNISKQILEQIRHPKGKFTIFDLEIDDLNKANFISDVILTIKVSEKVISFFYPYIFSLKNLSKQKKLDLVQKVCKADLAQFLSSQILLNKMIFKSISLENLAIMISKANYQTIYQILPFIRETFLEHKSMNEADLALIIIKFFEFNLKTEIEEIFNGYFNSNLISQILNKTENFQLFEYVVQINHCQISSFPEICSKSSFWVHIFSVISSSKDKYSRNLLLFIAKILEQKVNRNDVYEIFDAMIFSKFPSSYNGNCFLCDLIKETDLMQFSNLAENLDILITKIIDMKIIPLPSFWSLFPFEFIRQFFVNGENTNIIMNIAYEYAKSKYTESHYKIINIEALNWANLNKLNQLIKSRNLNLFNDNNDDLVSFIASAEIYTNQIEKAEIIGLTKDTILPFFAVCFIIYADSCNRNLLFKSTELERMFLDLIENESLYSIDIESINLILSFSNLFFSQSCDNNTEIFPSTVIFEMFSMLIDKLIDGNYKADEFILLKAIFEMGDKYPSNSTVIDILQKNGIKIFKYLTENIQKMEKFNDNCVNLEIFNLEMISSYLNKTFKNLHLYEKVTNTIYFLEKYCNIKNIPDIKFANPKGLESVINKTIKRKDWNKYFAMYSFIKKYIKNKDSENIRLTMLNSQSSEIENEIISALINESQIEQNKFHLKFLFDLLMNDSSTTFSYIAILLEKISFNNKILLEDILCTYPIEVVLYNDVFKKLLQEFYNYRKITNRYLDECFFWKMKKINLKYSKIGLSIISKILNGINLNYDNYNAFFILKRIALSFPFLFKENSEKVFQTILQSLNYFPLLFSKKNESSNKLLKTALMAQSFLFSVLYSVDVLESFLFWIFKVIHNLPLSQILAITFILESLFKTKKVKDVLLALSIKEKFPEIATHLLQIKINEEIDQIFKTQIYNLLILFYTNYNNMAYRKKSILINTLKNIDNPVQIMFNYNLSIYPLELQEFKLNISTNDELYQCIQQFNKSNESFQNQKYDYNLRRQFFCYFRALEERRISDKDKIKFPKDCFNKTNAIEICSKKPNMIYRYLIEGEKMHYFQEHHKILTVILNELKELKENDSKNYYEFKINIDFDLRPLFNLLINEIEESDLSEKLIKIIITDYNSKISFLKIIDDFINCHLYDVESIKCLSKFIIDLNIPKYELYYYCLNSMINYVLTHENENNFDVISSVIQNASSNVNISPKIVQVIKISLINNRKQDLSAILTICKKIDKRHLTSIKSLLEEPFGKMLDEKGISNADVFEIYTLFPSMINKNIEIADRILEEYIQRYKNGEDVIDSFCEFFNLITPERNKKIKKKKNSNTNFGDDDEYEYEYEDEYKNNYESFFNESVKNAKDTEIKFASASLIENDPHFWNLYNKFKDDINDMITRKEENFKKFKFFSIFPELTSFNSRLLQFRQNMRKIRSNDLDYDYFNHLSINRNDILTSSFRQLSGKSRSEWLRRFSIHFENEQGIDAGGLTKEWFTLVIKELFNPNFALFILSENNSYQPNPSSGINPDHIEYFKFAGKLIARALIQEQCVNAHFTSSFRRQILQNEVQLVDYKDIDKSAYDSLKYLLENDADDLCLNFTINDDEYGVNKTILLKENGEDIDVTNENKEEYVKLYVNYRLRKSIINQVNAFCEGFNWLIPHKEIKYFSQSELDLLICGIPEIDINDLKQNTIFCYPYKIDHPVIIMFFNVISKWKHDDLAKLLLFFTGSSQMPVNGFKDYKEKGNPITISPISDKKSLCRAHTCFNTLDLPQYDSEFELNKKLLQSIYECDNFGFG